jgi:hypothetical protein
MLRNQKYIFLFALIATLIVFNIGIFMGYMLESSRIEKINQMYQNTEMKILDQITQMNSFENFDFDCDKMFEENVRFGDKIFEEAYLISKYEEANIFSEEIVAQHKRFDLLRSLFWINSVKIKEVCDLDYHNVVYFYKYNEPNFEEKSKQNVISNLLYELKEKFGNSILLIPIAGDNDISSVNLLVDKYNITEFPVVLIDEKIVIRDISELEDIEKYL